VVSVLRHAIPRDLRRHRWQYVAIGATVAIGVALFAASSDAFVNLEASYARTYERLAFADMTITGGDVAGFADQARSVDGVAEIVERRRSDVPIRIGGDHSLLGRVSEIPDDGRPTVDRLDLIKGSTATVGSQNVVLERHLAEHFDLGPGDGIELYTAGRWTHFEVSGVAASAEYIWPARSRQDVLTSSDDFGVVFAPSDVVDAAASDPEQQALVRIEPGIDQVAVDASLRQLADAAGASSVELRADQPSNAALQEDVAGFGEISFLFPVLFLGSAAMATFVLQGRLIRSQRAQIATLRANGLSTRTVVGHHLAEGVVVTLAAGLVGLALGLPLGRLVTSVYTDAISVPDTVTQFHWATVVIALVLAVATGLVATAAPAIAAARTSPGDALRGEVPTGGGRHSLIERLVPPLSRLPARWRMTLRGIGRNKRRTATTGIGVVLALTLVLASWGMVDTVDILLERQFGQIQLQDAQLVVSGTAQSVIADVEGVPGVDRVEPVLDVPVTIGFGSASYATELIALGPDTRMHTFGPAGLPDNGFVVGRSLASVLGVTTGDVVAVELAGAELTAPIVAFVDEPLGTLVYTDLSAAESVVDPSAVDSLLVRFTADADAATMREALSELPFVVAYVDSRGLYDTARGLLSLFYAFVAVMLAFGGVMAFALLFNTASVNAGERAPELAALELNGTSSGQVGRLLAGETMLLTVLSLVPGLAVGYWVSAQLMDSFSSDLFDFGMEIRASTLVLSATAILAVAALAQWATARAVAHVDIARVVRERSS
jgi:putative ABC transport system permease protein